MDNIFIARFFNKTSFLFIVFSFIYTENLAQRSLPKTSNTDYLSVVSVNSSDKHLMIKIKNIITNNSLSFPKETIIIFKFNEGVFYSEITRVESRSGESLPFNEILEQNLQGYGKEFHLYFNPLPKGVNEFKLDYKSSNCNLLGLRCELISFSNIKNKNTSDYMDLYSDNIYFEDVFIDSETKNSIKTTKKFPYNINFNLKSEIIKYLDKKLNKKSLEGIYRSLDNNNRKEVIIYNTKNELPNSEYELLILYDDDEYQYNAFIIEANCDDCSNWNLADIKAIIYENDKDLEIIWKYPKNKHGGGFLDENFIGDYTENDKIIKFDNISLIQINH